MDKAWSVIVHGGAKTIRPERQEANRQGCVHAAEAASAVLSKGGSAVDAAVAAIRVLEDDPSFNAGYGCVVNADGEVELDAAVMEGANLNVGAVAALRGVKNPIDAAHALLSDKAVLLVGEGAARFAAEKGLTLCEPHHHICTVPADEACDTVGCVVMDQAGLVVAATSTGGLSGVRPGRVGDSPIPGCGLYAENGIGGVSFSGDGESILRLALAARLMRELESCAPAQAAGRAIEQMGRVGGEAGAIVIDATGRPGFAHNSRHFAVGIATHNRAARGFLEQGEFI